MIQTILIKNGPKASGMVGGHGAVYHTILSPFDCSCCWRALLGFDSRFLCDVSCLFFPKSTAHRRNHMKYLDLVFVVGSGTNCTDNILRINI